MSKHRHDLPQLRADAVLTDGGLKTTLVFHEGLDLPHFAAFPLLDAADGRRALRRDYEKYLALAAERSCGTDHRHVEAIRDACLPLEAQPAA